MRHRHLAIWQEGIRENQWFHKRRSGFSLQALMKPIKFVALDQTEVKEADFVCPYIAIWLCFPSIGSNMTSRRKEELQHCWGRAGGFSYMTARARRLPILRWGGIGRISARSISKLQSVSIMKIVWSMEGSVQRKQQQKPRKMVTVLWFATFHGITRGHMVSLRLSARAVNCHYFGNIAGMQRRDAWVQRPGHWIVPHLGSGKSLVSISYRKRCSNCLTSLRRRFKWQSAGMSNGNLDLGWRRPRMSSKPIEMRWLSHLCFVVGWL